MLGKSRERRLLGLRFRIQNDEPALSDRRAKPGRINISRNGTGKCTRSFAKCRLSPSGETNSDNYEGKIPFIKVLIMNSNLKPLSLG